MKRTKRIGKKKIWISTAVFLVAVAAIAGIIIVRGKKDKTNAFYKQSTVSLEKMDLTKSISATGTVAGRESKSVSVAVQNVAIKKILVKVGDTVKKGDELVQFDESDLKEALSEAEEDLADTKSTASQEIANAKKQYSSAVSNKNSDSDSQAKKIADAKETKKEAKAAVKEAKKKVKAAKTAQEKQTCQENLAKAEEALKQAESALETAEESRKNTLRQDTDSVDNASASLETARSNGEKNIKEAEKNVKEAQKALEQCSMMAPISGIVTAVNGEEGAMYSGETLFQIDDTSAYTVTTSVDEYDISDVAVGQRVVVLTEATDEDELEGEISFIAPSTQNSSESSGSQSAEMKNTSSSDSSGGYEVKINLTKEDERLRLGLTARCSIILEEAQDVYAVPYDAVQEDADGGYINVLDGETKGKNAESGTDSTRKLTVTKDMERGFGGDYGGMPGGERRK